MHTKYFQVYFDIQIDLFIITYKEAEKATIAKRAKSTLLVVVVEAEVVTLLVVGLGGQEVCPSPSEKQ